MTGEERRYDRGGHLPGGLTTVRNDTGAPIVIHPGEAYFSRATIETYGKSALRMLAGGDVEVIAAEDALAELDAEDES